MICLNLELALIFFLHFESLYDFCKDCEFRKVIIWLQMTIVAVGSFLPPEGDNRSSFWYSWEFGVPVMENFIPASMVWDTIATKHDW